MAISKTDSEKMQRLAQEGKSISKDKFGVLSTLGLFRSIH